MSEETQQRPEGAPAQNGDAIQVGDAVQCKPVEVVVGEKGVERAIKHLKRKMAAEGILRELKRRRHYMKPSVKRRKKESEAARRRRKREKQLQAR
ncbi:30S ribosomal protein S21 [Sandaracinus amylolyticus]|uniref:Small ribosomal subunit protein bS21 n=1 Tax=Sandaracinus amylolyticus TaxID=927083 RepID=A0A0F6W914_9BACT|nr:30S ribosomal protein S21 [Sandaracinus amylolyticus]AKF10486.1 SSU ribosomal protein S21p [Sandaracinus amylolyticus]